MMPRFSIIIPVYNIAPYLRECLDSVLAQTYTDWEAICIDDGSTDGSAVILEEYAGKDRRVRVVSQANAGVSAARNAALGIARGEWIRFLDGDDVLPPNSLANIEEAISKDSTADLVALQNRRFADGELYPWAGNQALVNICAEGLDVVDGAAAFSSRCVSRGFTRFVYRRANHGAVRFKNYKVGEDRLYLITCLSNARRIIVGETVIYGYRQRQGSTVHTQVDPRKAKDGIEWVLDALSIFVNSGKKVPDEVVRRFVNKLIEESASDVSSLGDSQEHERVSVRWYEALKFVKKNVRLTLWQGFVVRTVLTLRCCVLVQLLCVWPFWLKSKGMHR